MSDHRVLDALTSEVLQGRLGRRDLLKRAALLGITGTTLAGLLATCDEYWSTFTCFDIDEGLPVTTGPWRVVFSSPEQKIFHRRDPGWAIEHGLVDNLPEVERVVYLPVGHEGETLQMTLNGWDVFANIGPVVAEMLRLNGIDAEYAQPPDWSDMLEQGNHRAGFQGHGGSIANAPYDTLRPFQSTTVAVPGAHQVNFTRWVNEEYDALADEIVVTPPEDQEELRDHFNQAMEIWIPRASQHPVSGVVSTDPDELDLLGELANRGQRLRQRPLLASDVPGGAEQSSGDTVAAPGD